MSRKAEVHPVLKMLLEFGPLVLFFWANAKGDDLIENYSLFSGFTEPIFVATAVFMVAITISVSLGWWLNKEVPVMPLVTGIMVLAFGGLTLYLADETFIKVKPTIANSFFGAVLLGGLAFGKMPLKYVFDSAFSLTDEGWHKLTIRWGIFFFVLALINEVVWRTQTTDFWVAFKVWGIMPLTLILAGFQFPLLQRYMIEDEAVTAKADD